MGSLMQDRSEKLHQQDDLAEKVDRLDHFLSELRALIDKYEVANLSICEMASLERMGKIREKF